MIEEFRKQTDYISIVFIHTESARAGALVLVSLQFFDSLWTIPQKQNAIWTKKGKVKCGSTVHLKSPLQSYKFEKEEFPL